MRYIIVLAVIIFTTSCSVKKRTYRNGYYVDWVLSKKHSDTKGGKQESVEKLTGKDRKDQILNKEIDSEIASSERGIDQINIEKKQNLLLLSDTCGDQIFFKSGDLIVAKVLEVTEDKIKYKRCDNLDGPQFVVLKSSVQSIKYTNGITESIETTTSGQPTKPYQNQNVQVPQQYHPLAIGSMVACVLGFIIVFPFIASIIMASNAIHDIKADPKKYKGTILAEVARAISIFMLILMVLLIIFVILLAFSFI